MTQPTAEDLLRAHLDGHFYVLRAKPCGTMETADLRKPRADASSYIVDRTGCVSDSKAKTHYGFTLDDVERRRVALAIAGGLTLEHIAGLKGVSVKTLKRAIAPRGAP